MAAHAPADARGGRLRAGARGPAARVERRARARARRARSRPRCAAATTASCSSACTATSPTAGTTTLEGIDRLRVDHQRDDAPARAATPTARWCSSSRASRAMRATSWTPWFDVPGRAQPRPHDRLRPLVGARAAACAPTSLVARQRLRVGPRAHARCGWRTGGVRGAAARGRQAEKTSDALLRRSRATSRRVRARGLDRRRRSARRATTPRLPHHEPQRLHEARARPRRPSARHSVPSACS